MPTSEQGTGGDAYSTQFGALEAFDVFNGARSIEQGEAPEELAGRTFEGMAEDAVNTAIRFRRDAEEPQPYKDIDREVATAALMTRIVEELGR